MDRKQCISFMENGCIISVITDEGEGISGIVRALNPAMRVATVDRGNKTFVDINLDKIAAIRIKTIPANIDKFKGDIDLLSGDELIERVKEEFLSTTPRVELPLRFRFPFGRAGTNQNYRLKIVRWAEAIQTLQEAFRLKNDGIVRQIALYAFSIKHDGYVQSQKFPNESIEDQLNTLPPREYVTLYGGFNDPVNYTIEQGQLLEIDSNKRMVKLRSTLDERNFEVSLDAIYAIDFSRAVPKVVALR
ncbi:hypothetical protein [Burkholderia mayonis]|uniref:hypothetical protein n=1 Tax=Burkholderia mayonis TaxID=1385591 RepID=UPI000A656763|nr:hypothetical protein [Burkholderia mayonis]